MIEEQKLIKKAVSGKSEAFGELYDYYQPIIYRFIYLKVSHKENAEDLTHQVFLSAWERISEFRTREGASFCGWLYAIARNKVIDHYRTKRLTITIEEFEDPPKTESNEKIADFNLEIGKVKKAIPQLNELEQDVIIMRFIEDFSPKETAKILNKNEGVIRVIQHRAIKNLRKILNGRKFL